MRAGLATLDVLEEEDLGDARRRRRRTLARARCARASSRYEMVEEVRGLGQLSGIEFQPPRELALARAVRGVRQHPSRRCSARCSSCASSATTRIFSQICGNDFMVLKASPALNVSDAQIDAVSRRAGGGRRADAPVEPLLERGARHGPPGPACHLSGAWRPSALASVAMRPRLRDRDGGARAARRDGGARAQRGATPRSGAHADRVSARRGRSTRPMARSA